MVNYEVVDFHADLLCYLAGEVNRDPKDREPRCGYHQLEKGGVKCQILPVFCETMPDSSKLGDLQRFMFRQLYHPTIQFRIAIENASSLCDETEPLTNMFERVDPDFVYIGLTWNFENRFGGGALTQIGLKEDGKSFLRFLSGKGISIDFSHASDQLAEDILNLIDKENLALKVIASHSNYRAIFDAPRNLPDHLAKEIFSRGGVIGLNAVKYFTGSHPSDFCRHIEHGIQLSGGLDQIVLGLDFFHLDDFDKKPDEVYFSEYADAECYPKLFTLIKQNLLLSDKEIQKIASENALRYL